MPNYVVAEHFGLDKARAALIRAYGVVEIADSGDVTFTDPRQWFGYTFTIRNEDPAPYVKFSNGAEVYPDHLAALSGYLKALEEAPEHKAAS